MATGAIINALWDLWAKLLKKPVWQLLTDLEPEQLVSTIDFRYVQDVITKEEAIRILHECKNKKEDRIDQLKLNGYPAYTTQVGSKIAFNYLLLYFLTFLFFKVGWDTQMKPSKIYVGNT